MELIVISSPDLLENEAAIINALFSAGMGLFHLRKPGASVAELRALLQDIDPAFRTKLVLHQHHLLCSEYELKRRHFPEALRLQYDQDYFVDQRQQGIHCSTSIHSLDLLPALTAFEYVFFGPVFNSISKPGYETSLALDFQIPEGSEPPAIIALGGIEPGNVQQVKTMNFLGIAVLGAIWNNAGNPVHHFKRLSETCMAYSNKQ